MCVCVCVGGGGLPRGAHWSHCEAHGDGVSPLWSSLGSRVMCSMRACAATKRDPRTRMDIHHKPQT